MSDESFTTVLRTMDANEAEIVRIALENEGIKAAISNEGQAGFTGVFEILVSVLAEDADRAKEIIQSHSSPDTDED